MTDTHRVTFTVLSDAINPNTQDFAADGRPGAWTVICRLGDHGHRPVDITTDLVRRADEAWVKRHATDTGSETGASVGHTEVKTRSRCQITTRTSTEKTWMPPRHGCRVVPSTKADVYKRRVHSLFVYRRQWRRMLGF